MLSLNLTKLGGPDIDIPENLNEYTYRQYELLFSHLEDFNIIDYLKDLGVPKKVSRLLPREILDMTEWAISATIQEIESLEDKEYEPVKNLPWYRWHDIEYRLQTMPGVEWLKYLVVIVENDYDLAKDPDYLDREAEKLLDEPVVEGVRYLSFFLMTDARFLSIFNQSMPQTIRLKLLPHELMLRNSISDMEDSSKLMMQSTTFPHSEQSTETTQE